MPSFVWFLIAISAAILALALFVLRLGYKQARQNPRQ